MNWAERVRPKKNTHKRRIACGVLGSIRAKPNSATDPATAQCLAPPAATAALDIVAGATPTFSIFVAQSLGIAIPFDPAQARLFVRFADASGNLRGATSVAIRTE